MSEIRTDDVPLGTPASATERPIRELFVELWEHTETLVRQELRLASTEMEAKVSEAKSDLTKAAVGGAVLYAGVLALLAFAILFLAKFVAPWVAALLVAVVAIGIGYALLQKGKEVTPSEMAPERTIRNVRRDLHTFREATK